MDVSQVLKDSGIAVVGNIDSKLIENVSKYSQSSATKQWRYQSSKIVYEVAGGQCEEPSG